MVLTGGNVCDDAPTQRPCNDHASDVAVHQWWSVLPLRARDSRLIEGRDPFFLSLSLSLFFFFFFFFFFFSLFFLFLLLFLDEIELILPCSLKCSSSRHYCQQIFTLPFRDKKNIFLKNEINANVAIAPIWLENCPTLMRPSNLLYMAIHRAMLWPDSLFTYSSSGH